MATWKLSRKNEGIGVDCNNVNMRCGISWWSCVSDQRATFDPSVSGEMGETGEMGDTGEMDSESGIEFDGGKVSLRHG